MAEGIKISLDEVSSTASTIRTLNTSMNATLESIKKEMNNLSSTWQSDAGETIRTRFNTMSASFEEYKKIVDSYATFLDDTVSTYETTENTINSNADAFA
ncbi:MAG: WXG100 family type VII secretion target [Lachnospiraceae bacterium]|nr:WXG100 family type VII secretion target [Lachnospiraceae bacterium]